ncbi:MAG: DUF47 domain-containing protein, partial [Planctomycetota bacterium]
MPEIKTSPFQKTRRLQGQIDEFLDKVSEAAMVFEQAMLHYVEQGYDETMDQKFEHIAALESRGDELRRSIELTLYTEMLIPEARGDVLGLLDDLDGLLDSMKKRFLNLTIERTHVPAEFAPGVRELVAAVTRCIETTVLAARAYFRDPRSVRDHLHKVGFYESESDQAAIRLRQAIADSELKLAQKILLREAVIAIDQLADDAEDAGD